MQSKPASMSASSGGLVEIPCRYHAIPQVGGRPRCGNAVPYQWRTTAKSATFVLTVSRREGEIRLLNLPKAFTLSKSLICGSAAESATKSTMTRTNYAANPDHLAEAAIMVPGRPASGDPMVGVTTV